MPKVKRQRKRERSGERERGGGGESKKETEFEPDEGLELCFIYLLRFWKDGVDLMYSACNSPDSIPPTLRLANFVVRSL